MNQGLGAYQDQTGTWQFSVWAPNADTVSLVGVFNNWDENQNPMQKNANGVWSTSLKKAKVGDQYKYHIVNQGKVYARMDPYARKVTSSVGNSVLSKPPVASTNPQFQAADLNRLVIYELHIGTFGRRNRPCNSPATFKSSIPYLDELRELGVNAIEIMPIQEFAGGISWGYNPSNLFAVESDYGSAQDFYDFVQAAHERGLAVILDVVYNHFGPTDLDLWQFDGWNENGKGGIYNFVTKRGLAAGKRSRIAWTQIETGSSITWKYPSCVLRGDESSGEFFSIAVSNHRQQADTGTKMIHIGKNTTSRIVSKGISAGNAQNSYRGLVRINPGAAGARNHTQCDSLLIGPHCGAHTYPYVDTARSDSVVEHEATTTRISEERLFYCEQRGIDAQDATALIVGGFCQAVLEELPMEFALEAKALLAVSLEGAVG